MHGEELVTLTMCELAALREHWKNGGVLPDEKLKKVAGVVAEMPPQKLEKPASPYDPPNKLG